METIGDRIKRRRLELGYTQEELSTKLGYKNRSSVNQMENSTELPLKKITRLAEVLKVSPSYLMGWDINLTQNANHWIISNNLGEQSVNSADSNSYTTNNYYSGYDCGSTNKNVDTTVDSKEYLFRIINSLKNMTDEQLLDMIKYADFVLSKDR